MICSRCGECDDRQFYKSSYSGRKKNLCKRCTKRCMTERCQTVKRKSIDYLGGRCIRCGYDKSLSAFDFHHRDSKEKEICISSLIRKFPVWEKLTSELDKCDLLCANCHRELHCPNITEFEFDNSDILDVERIRRNNKFDNNPLCKHCGKGIPIVTGKKPRMFCSDECAGSFRKSGVPNKDQLKGMISQMTSADIAAHFGVCQRTIQKWLKIREISVPRVMKEPSSKKVCHQCEGEFCPRKTSQKFCSKNCETWFRRRHWPSADQLREMLKTKTHREIGGIFGVHHATVQHWRTSLGVE